MRSYLPHFFPSALPNMPPSQLYYFLPFGNPLSPVSAAYTCMDTGAFTGMALLQVASPPGKNGSFPSQARASGSPGRHEACRSSTL